MNFDVLWLLKFADDENIDKTKSKFSNLLYRIEGTEGIIPIIAFSGVSFFRLFQI